MAPGARNEFGAPTFQPKVFREQMYYTDVGVAKGTQGAMSPKFVEYVVILCFEMWYHKQNTVAGLKIKILAPKNFGLTTPVYITEEGTCNIVEGFRRPVAPLPILRYAPVYERSKYQNSLKISKL